VPVQVMIRSRLRPEHAQECLSSLRAVYDELAALDPGGLRWAAFQLDDGVSMVSFVEFAGLPGQAPHHRLASFQRHRAALDRWCEEPPVVQVLHQVGAYGFPEPIGRQAVSQAEEGTP